MKMTPLEYTLFIWLECLGIVTITILLIVLISILIALVMDVIKGTHHIL